MDKFVIRTPRAVNKAAPLSHPPKNHRGGQKKLNQLRGVVVLEKIQDYQKVLRSSRTSDEDKVAILQKLCEKQPSTEIIIKTGIGKAVSALTKDKCAEVAQNAQAVKDAWQQAIERRVELSLSEKPTVKIDLETERIRNKSLTLLNRTYVKKYQLDFDLLKALEKRLFAHFRPCIGAKYRRAVRTVIANPSRFVDAFKANDLEAVIAEVLKKK